MGKPLNVYGRFCVTAAGVLALALPAQAENVKKKHIGQPKYEDVTTAKQGQSGSTAPTRGLAGNSGLTTAPVGHTSPTIQNKK